MAFGPSITSARQTATNAAAQLVAAGLTLEDVKENFDAIRTFIFEDLQTFIKQETESAPAQRSSAAGNGRGSASVSNPGDLVINWGAFKGMSLGAIATMSAADAKAESAKNGKSYDKPGVKYIEYLANNKDPKASYVRKYAQAFLDQQRTAA